MAVLRELAAAAIVEEVAGEHAHHEGHEAEQEGGIVHVLGMHEAGVHRHQHAQQPKAPSQKLLLVHSFGVGGKVNARPDPQASLCG